jgi:predicted acetylornithine/succinylornithine family transaminase
MRQELIEKERKYVMQTYTRLPINLVRGEGVYLWDDQGKQYLDFVSGLGAINLGHCHPNIQNAVAEQAGKLIHVSNLFYTEPQVELAELICTLSFGDKCFFANSGAEANEAAIKLARKYAQLNKAPTDSGESGTAYPFEIITALKGFHGRTLATLAATGQLEKQKFFLPMPQGFKHVPFNDLDAVTGAVTEKTCAIMLEAIQGEGGVNVAQEEYLEGVRKLCGDYDILLILDEVQTGLGRTGKLFAYEHYGIKPDIMTLAKGLGSGFPIGVMVGSTKVSSIFEPGDHATTFGGAPLVSTVALATLKVLERENVVENCARVGAYFREKLQNLAAETKLISEIRGKGLIIGAELKESVAKKVVTECLNRGLIINNIGENTLRFLPPLIVSEHEIDKAMDIIEGVLASPW